MREKESLSQSFGSLRTAHSTAVTGLQLQEWDLRGSGDFFQPLFLPTPPDQNDSLPLELSVQCISPGSLVP